MLLEMSLKNKKTAGFSLIEMVVVAAVILVVIAIALPSFKQTLDGYRLDASGRAVASLLQQTRIQAARHNQPFYAQIDTSTTPNRAYANTDKSAFTEANAQQNGEAVVYLDGDVGFQTTGLPDHTQLDALMNNGNTGAVGVISGAIGFNARGLPCTQGSSVGVCIEASNAANYFEWFMQNKSNLGWEAVTVTPAGRIKFYRLTGTSSTSCGYPACWQ